MRASRGCVASSTTAIPCSPTRAFLAVSVFVSVLASVFVSVFVSVILSASVTVFTREACLQFNVCRKSTNNPTQNRPDLTRPRVKQLRNFEFSLNFFNQI